MHSKNRVSRNAMMQKRINRQEGWTFWSLAFTLGVIVFFAYIGMQLVPVYQQNEAVKSAMEVSLEGERLVSVTRPIVEKKIYGQLYVDGYHNSIDLKDKDTLIVKRSQKELILNTKNQREIPLYFNLSIVAKFDNVLTKDLVQK